MICVQHNDGWCALKRGTKLDPRALHDATECGHVVTMRTGNADRGPTCFDCRKALHLHAPNSTLGPCSAFEDGREHVWREGGQRDLGRYHCACCMVHLDPMRVVAELRAAAHERDVFRKGLSLAMQLEHGREVTLEKVEAYIADVERREREAIEECRHASALGPYDCSICNPRGLEPR